jgi:hypothetical protein
LIQIQLSDLTNHEGDDMTGQHNQFMARAIELSEKTSLIDSAGGVFATVIVQNGEITGEGANRVVAENDPTWHGRNPGHPERVHQSRPIQAARADFIYQRGTVSHVCCCSRLGRN